MSNPGDNHSGIKPVLTEAAPRPAGHYSQAVRSKDTLYISGQLPIRADGNPLADTSFETQVRQAIANMLAILETAGGKPGDLCRVTAYIVGVENWPEFNRIYADMIGEAKPARTVVPVPELHYGLLVEVDAVATLATTDA
ncbi:RidA family protein [Novosphingobium resinovorum]|uniref:Reactive intermediate/imine deaminase n=1 Tax=Novosphingobium resinovorum TaxID=158500 RepID=A0A1D8A2T0_9SPHN|nr:RidA family protein [Novosphingobium resinovorum]AOR76409.1 reactive intermediate/imine deaminase [Novosphingobium resinovorum]